MIPLHKVFMPIESIIEARKVLGSGWVGEGNRVAELEQKASELLENPFVNALNNGTMGLEIVCKMLDLGPEDEVITTPNTCSATNIPFARTGAKLVWADVDPLMGNIDPRSVAERVTHRTKAVVVVHYGGYPVDIERVRQALKSAPHYIPIIEDAAHALGARYKHMPMGRCNYGTGQNTDYCMFSFQAIKHINSVDGGLLTCYRAEDYERARTLRWYGIDRKYRRLGCYGYWDWDIRECGFKGHMNDVAASIVAAQLPYLPQILRDRFRNADIYDNGLLGEDIELPIPVKEQWDSGTVSSNWLYTILVYRRKDFIRVMKERGADCGVVHMRNDIYPVFQGFRRNDLEGLEHYSQKCVSIPVGQWVTEEDAHHIVDMIRQGW